MPCFKFIACSDIHIRKTTPVSRKDLFYSSLRRKLAWLFKFAADEDAYIICGGDVFDTVSVPHELIEDIIKLAIRYNVKLLTVYGQHDLRYHVYRSHKNTPLAIVLTALNTGHLDETPFINDLVAVQGASWGRTIPPIVPGKINILATHRMVTEYGAQWPGHTDYTVGTDLLETDKYDIVVSGDNHRSFMCEKDGRYLINSGSFARSSIIQVDYKPRVVLCTVDDKITCEWIDVPIRDALMVFKADVVEEHNKKSDLTKEQLQAFTTQLNAYKMEKPDFMYNLHKIKETITDKHVIDVLDKIANKVGLKLKAH